MSDNIKTKIVQNFKKPWVLVTGGLIGLFILWRNHGASNVSYSQSGYDGASALAAQRDNNATQLASAQINASTQQAQIAAQSQAAIAAGAINADVTKSTLSAQTMVALGQFDLQKTLGVAKIAGDTSLGLNAQNVNAIIATNTQNVNRDIALSNNAANVANYQTESALNLGIHQGFIAQNLGFASLPIQAQALNNQAARDQQQASYNATALASNFLLQSKQSSTPSGGGNGFANVLDSVSNAASKIIPLF